MKQQPFSQPEQSSVLIVRCWHVDGLLRFVVENPRTGTRSSFDSVPAVQQFLRGQWTALGADRGTDR